LKKGEKGEQSKSKLIACAAQLFWKNGYNSTGINDILAEAHLPKGSFYFHFASKKDLAVAVTAYYEDKINQWLEQTALGKDWETFVSDFSETMLRGAEQEQHFGCPFAVIGLEIAFTEPEIAVHYAESMSRLKKIFQSVLLRSGLLEENASMLVDRLFATYEGHLLLYRISKDIAALQTMRTDLIGIFKDHLKANS